MWGPMRQVTVQCLYMIMAASQKVQLHGAVVAFTQQAASWLVCCPQVLFHAPLLRDFYLGEGHSPATCKDARRGRPCLSCQMVRSWPLEAWLPSWGAGRGGPPVAWLVALALGARSRPLLEHMLSPVVTPACQPALCTRGPVTAV